LSEDSEIISDAWILAALKLIILEAATTFLKKEKGIDPDTKIVQEITQEVEASRLRKLRDVKQNKTDFQAKISRIVAEVV
jgi:hypothetical protein